MSPSPNIVYLKRKDIDVERWDACIEQAENGLIYAYSYYLDAMCTNWDALVLGDYEVVMPLPWRKKWGIRYVYQPAFIQRLGVFGNNITSENLLLFLKTSLAKFQLLHYNVDQLLSNSLSQKKRKNFVIDLSKSYAAISSKFTHECKKNIRKAENRGCSLTTNIFTQDIVRMFRSAYEKQNSNISEADYKQFILLIETLKKRQSAILFAVVDELKAPIFSSILLKDNQRLYYVLGAPTNEGRKKRATYFFINEILKMNAEKKMMFDFEGSDIPDVEAFYQRFGPQAEYYYELKASRLPIISKLL